MSFDVWIAIMLAGITLLVTILGLMLGALGLFLGAAALWGFDGMKKAAGEAAQKEAEKIIRENKDKWLKDMGLGLELPVAESESSPKSSNDRDSVSPPYPVKEAQNASANDNAEGSDPTAPADASH